MPDGYIRIWFLSESLVTILIVLEHYNFGEYDHLLFDGK